MGIWGDLGEPLPLGGFSWLSGECISRLSPLLSLCCGLLNLSLIAEVPTVERVGSRLATALLAFRFAVLGVFKATGPEPATPPYHLEALPDWIKVWGQNLGQKQGQSQERTVGKTVDIGP